MRLRELGATVDEVSIPLHRMGQAIWLPIAAEGATAQMMLGNGYGFNWKGLYVTSLLDFHAGWRDRADELSDSLKLTMLLGYHMIRNYRGHYYAKAQNLARQLGAAYDAVLARLRSAADADAADQGEPAARRRRADRRDRGSGRSR